MLQIYVFCYVFRYVTVFITISCYLQIKKWGGVLLYMFCALICLNCGRQNIERQDTAVFLCFVLVTYDGMAVKKTHL